MSAAAVVALARKQIGKPYLWGGADPSTGFDCSGLVVYCFQKAAGISLPHFTGDLMTKGTAVSRANLKAGDLIFPNDHHVGICISNSQYIHAPQTGETVKISSINNFYKGRRIL